MLFILNVILNIIILNVILPHSLCVKSVFPPPSLLTSPPLSPLSHTTGKINIHKRRCLSFTKHRNGATRGVTTEEGKRKVKQGAVGEAKRGVCEWVEDMLIDLEGRGVGGGRELCFCEIWRW